MKKRSETMNKSSTNSEIEVSVIIVNYNTGKLLKGCVDSIFETTDKLKNPKCEIIIVDNNSADGSADFNGSFTRLKNTDNIGFAKANNQGIRKARGKYIFLLNPDTKLRDGSLNKLLKFAKSTQDAGVVGAKLVLADGSLQKSVFYFPTVWRAIQEFWFGKKSYSSFIPKTDKPLAVDAVVGAAFLISPQAITRVGLLDERYFIYFEDIDYCWRVKEAGLKVYYHPGARIIHYHGASGKDLAKDQEQWKRLVPSSIIYHGLPKHYLVNWVIWFGKRILHRK